MPVRRMQPAHQGREGQALHRDGKGDDDVCDREDQRALWTRRDRQSERERQRAVQSAPTENLGCAAFGLADVEIKPPGHYDRKPRQKHQRNSGEEQRNLLEDEGHRDHLGAQEKKQERVEDFIDEGPEAP